MSKNENSNSFGREQRSKNQRWRRKPNEKQSEVATSDTAVGNVNNPQPQRSHRRQRNEPANTAPNNEAISTPPSSTETKGPTEKENATIDFSGLKRETEEIEKYTKKFAKRNISSNWHRYSAPEGPQDDGKEEEEAPADFSDLIQVPSSKGGHLQLKEEQEWSSAAHEQLGVYFALNLKQLSQSLACIPLYEQLRLPTNMFNEEELTHFDNIASQERKSYKPDEIEDPKISNARNKSDISNVDESNHKLSNINLQSGLISETPLVDNHSSTRNYSEDEFILNDSNKEEHNSLLPDSNHIDYISLSEINSNNLPSLSQYTENEISETESIEMHKPNNVIEHINDKMNLSEAVKEIPANKTDTFSIIPTNNNNTESISTVQPLEKRTKSKRELNATGSSKTVLNQVENILKVEDDDDLDFLLSLKKPTMQEKKNTVSNLDSKPENTLPLQGSSSQKLNELDDWLDSVLQD